MKTSILVLLFTILAVFSQQVTCKLNKTYYLGDPRICQNVRNKEGERTSMCTKGHEKITNKISWYAAKGLCYADSLLKYEGARLASIGNQEEQTEMEKFLSTVSPSFGSNFWIGGTFEFSENDYVWENKESMNFTHWAPSVNLTVGTKFAENYRSVYIDRDGYWHRARKYDDMSFICERPQ